ncbi:MAG TPA: hypothetical protein VLS96_03950 [Nodosilinea sp.]|nr:hypothetical protein [Nodosilinea sp.]
MVKLGRGLGLGQAVPPRERLAAALAAVAICDRRFTQSGRSAGDRGWQEGLLRVAQACAAGEKVQHISHLQSLTDPAAIALTAFPYLWLQADAHGHHRAAVSQWVDSLGLAPAAAAACHDLFTKLCQTLGAGPGPLPLARAAGATLTSAQALVNQSQGQLAVALGVAERRQWSSAEQALVALLVGWGWGLANLGASQGLPGPARPSRPGEAPARPGLTPAALTPLALALYQRWAGVGGQRASVAPPGHESGL